MASHFSGHHQTDELFDLICRDAVDNFNTDKSRSIKSNRKHPQPSLEHQVREEQSKANLRLPSNFNSIIESIENRYKNSSTDRANCLIDIRNLTVIGSTLPVLPGREQEFYPASPISLDSSTSWESEFDSESEIGFCFTPKAKQRQQHQRKALKMRDHSKAVRSLAPMTSMTHYVPSQFQSQTKASRASSLARYELPSSSLIYDLEYQDMMLKGMKQRLLQSDALDLRQSLERKILETLGLPGIPSAESLNILPFITFDDKGEFYVTFVYDSPPSTFWPKFLRQIFSSAYLMLQKEVYELISVIPQSHAAANQHRGSVDNIFMRQTEMEFSESSDMSDDQDYEVMHPPLRRSTPLLPPTLFHKQSHGDNHCHTVPAKRMKTATTAATARRASLPAKKAKKSDQKAKNKKPPARKSKSKTTIEVVPDPAVQEVAEPEFPVITSLFTTPVGTKPAALAQTAPIPKKRGRPPKARLSLPQPAAQNAGAAASSGPAKKRIRVSVPASDSLDSLETSTLSPIPMASSSQFPVFNLMSRYSGGRGAEDEVPAVVPEERQTNGQQLGSSKRRGRPPTSRRSLQLNMDSTDTESLATPATPAVGKNPAATTKQRTMTVMRTVNQGEVTLPPSEVPTPRRSARRPATK